MLFAILLAFSFIFPLPASLQVHNVIEGRVATADSRPVTNAQVTLQNEGYSPIRSAYTDSSGRFHFMNLPNANYTVVVEPGTGTIDFERQTQRVEAQAFNTRRSGGGEVFRADFVVKPRKSAGPTVGNN